jgi:hypothetical protein
MTFNRHKYKVHVCAVHFNLYAFSFLGKAFYNSLQEWTPVEDFNKIGTVHSLEYTDITKAFFTPHHVGLC